ncbi:MAG: DNA polymerase III subunit alpha [Hyphomicrobiales bacterium]
MQNLDFVHLRVHSAYSLLEGAIQIGALLELTKSNNMPAVGIADTGNLFGALEFSDKAQGKGIQPIVGCQLIVNFKDVVLDPRAREGRGNSDSSFGNIVLIAKNELGFLNLSKLVSRSFLDAGEEMKPHVSIDALTDLKEGLICLSGGLEGAVDPLLSGKNEHLAKERLDTLSVIFRDNFYIEIQRHGDPNERISEPFLVGYAYENDVALVATNEVFFPEHNDFEAHDALIAISEGRVVAEDDRRKLTAQHYFKSGAEMAELFSDLPEALSNTVEIAQRCSYRPQKHAPILPSFTGEASDAATEDNAAVVKREGDELRRQAIAGLESRLALEGLAPGVDRETYDKRLEYELEVIVGMKYPGYFLIVADFIKWAKIHDVPVGPGRGSGAGSLVAWSLTITDIDPLRFSLLFERFLNPERVSMPDFDIDFCQEKRDQVIRYVQERYGSAQVAQIITFGTLQARAVLRDVGRVLQMPYGQVDRLCKMVPSTPANPITLKEAIATESSLREAAEEEDVVAKLFSIATRLEGLYRHASTHAAGIVIGDRPLEQLVPLYRDPRSDMPVTQYNMKWVEQAGLVKFDFLGLKTLTILERAVSLIARRGIEIDLGTVPLDDKQTYEMLSRGETAGVFQLESQGMRRALAGMKPDRFEDIIALVALYRPGPMDNIPTYNRRKHKLEEPDYMHPLLEEILKETHGVIIYQEQVMQIAQKLSGYSLGEADLLRRAMGKKIKAEMDVQRVRFVDGAVENNVKNAQANTIFDLVARFADYGFNKSHAAAYALVAYHTAYLKANHPVEFLAATMTLDMGNTDKLSDFRQEAARMEVPVLPPCVTKSDYEFEVEDGQIIYALGALKGVGRHVIEEVTAARDEKPFEDLSDFAERVDAKVLNKRTLDALVCAGAFDVFVENRAKLFAGLDRVMAHSQRISANAKTGQDELFGGAGADREKIILSDVQAWKTADRLIREHKAIGLYLTAHPLDEYGTVLQKMNIPSWEEFQTQAQKGKGAGRLAATVIAKQERKTKSGSRMGILTLSDPSGQYEATLYSERLSEYRDMLEIGHSFIFTVGADVDEDTEEVRVRIQSLSRLEEKAANGFAEMAIFAHDESPLKSISTQLNACMSGRPDGPRRSAGKVTIILMLENGQRDVIIKLPGGYPLSAEFAGSVKSIEGVVDVTLQ